jgi:hypothetical protein
MQKRLWLVMPFCTLFIPICRAQTPTDTLPHNAAAYKDIYKNVWLPMQSFNERGYKLQLCAKLPPVKGATFAIAETVCTNKTIYLEQKAYNYCKQALGDNAYSALAFLLGHELAHSTEPNFQINCVSGCARNTHYAPDQIAATNGIKKESAADITGLLHLHIAGFKTKDIVTLLPKLYDFYQLSDDVTHPPLTQRVSYFAAANAKADRAYALFQTATVLNIVGKHATAAHVLAALWRELPAPEVQQNLATSYLQEVQADLQAAEKLFYRLPFGINSHLTSSREGSLTEIGLQIAQRESYLAKAENLYAILLQANKNDSLTLRNTALLHILRQANKGIAITALVANFNQTNTAQILPYAPNEVTVNTLSLDTEIINDAKAMQGSVTDTILTQQSPTFWQSNRHDADGSVIFSITATDIGYTGATARGIKIGSTTRAVTDKYGAPAAILQGSEHRFWYYKDTNNYQLIFEIQADKVTNWLLL